MRKKTEKYSFKSDPRGLISEAYNIPEISAKDCRSIFFDWALGLREDFDPILEIKKLHEFYSAIDKNHPMTAVLSEGLTGFVRNNRRRKRTKSKVN